MKLKTSVTLSERMIQEIEKLAGKRRSRSSFLEEAAWAYIAQLKREQTAERDLRILEASADFLNEEMAGALTYQVHQG